MKKIIEKGQKNDYSDFCCCSLLERVYVAESARKIARG